jgi:Ca2+/Na+ antiporter
MIALVAASAIATFVYIKKRPAYIKAQKSTKILLLKVYLFIVAPIAVVPFLLDDKLTVRGKLEMVVVAFVAFFIVWLLQKGGEEPEETDGLKKK